MDRPAPIRLISGTLTHVQGILYVVSRPQLLLRHERCDIWRDARGVGAAKREGIIVDVRGADVCGSEVAFHNAHALGRLACVLARALQVGLAQSLQLAHTRLLLNGGRRHSRAAAASRVMRACGNDCVAKRVVILVQLELGILW